MNDRDRIAAAVGEAQRVLANFYERSEGCPTETIDRVIALLGDKEALGAFHRLFGEQAWVKSSDLQAAG